MRVGHIREIWRYPVKSMAGERLEMCEVHRSGMLGDRCWALRNDKVGEIQGARKFPRLLQCTASYRTPPAGGTIPPVDIRFPEGDVLGSDSERLSDRLRDLTGGTPASLWPLQAPDALDFYRRRAMSPDQLMEEMAGIFQREDGEPLPDLAQFPQELIEYTSMPGMFFDALPLHVLTTASLAHMQACNAAADWDVRRFRPNLLVETVDTLGGLAETDWIGRKLRVGALVIDCQVATPRCGMVAQRQPGLAFDKSVLRSVVREADQSLGLYAAILEAGSIRIGDPVELLD